jgi:SAM-dependent methyltransferase
VDVLSFERRDPLDVSWMAYGQFIRTFVLPLLAHRSFQIPLAQIFTANRDGLDPETVYQWVGALRALTPPYLGLVTLPHLLGARKAADESAYTPKPASSAEQAQFILSGLLRKSRRQLEAVAPEPQSSSTWTGYLDHKSLYGPAQLAQKEKFVQQALDLARPKSLLDVGANEGHFSFLAARRGASVVAIDNDAAVVGSIWKQAYRENLDVLPLVVDLTRPTPATGWRNQENLSFLDRAGAGFDMVSMLAVLHHILVSERIPLEELLSLADQLTGRYLLIEFVGPEDPMFRRILRGREKLYRHVSREWFEAKAQSRFELIRSEKIDGLNRWIYLFERPSAKS